MTSKLIKTGLVLAAMLAAPFAANAADLRAPTYKAPAYVAPLAPSWTGFYVGLNAGYGFGDADWPAAGPDPSPSGFLIGGTLGYNLQTGSWVWGIEGDIAYSRTSTIRPVAARRIRRGSAPPAAASVMLAGAA